MSDPGDGTDRRLLPAGTKVEVRTGFDGSWSTGFAIEAVTAEGTYRIRRRSDDEVLPTEFRSGAVRRERKSSMWWV